jgi:hypothetical protein
MILTEGSTYGGANPSYMANAKEPEYFSLATR